MARKKYLPAWRGSRCAHGASTPSPRHNFGSPMVGQAGQAQVVSERSAWVWGPVSPKKGATMGVVFSERSGVPAAACGYDPRSMWLRSHEAKNHVSSIEL